MSGKAATVGGSGGGCRAAPPATYKGNSNVYDFAAYKRGAPYAFLGSPGRAGGCHAGGAGSPKSNYTTNYAPMRIFGRAGSYRMDDEEERRRAYKDFRRAA